MTVAIINVMELFCFYKCFAFQSKKISNELQVGSIALFMRLKRWVWAESSEFVSSSIPSWQILTAHAQPFRGARDLGFCLKVPLVSLLVWASSEGSGETARMRSLAWTFAARIGDKYQIRLARPSIKLQGSGKHCLYTFLESEANNDKVESDKSKFKD